MLRDDRLQLERVIGLVQKVLGPDVLGAYLFGSAVVGGVRPASDLDVLVVTSRPTSRDEKRRLVETLLSISDRPTAEGRRRHVELTIVVASELRPWRYPPSFDFQYGDWLRREFEGGDVEPWPTRTNPDLATLIAMVLLADTPLLGPPPAEVVDAVPQRDLARALVESVDPLLADLESDTRNVILTLARIWCTLATGEIHPKDSAADWAIARLPDEQRAVLAHARAAYLGEEEERWDDLAPLVQPHAEHVVAEITRLRG